MCIDKIFMGSYDRILLWKETCRGGYSNGIIKGNYKQTWNYPTLVRIYIFHILLSFVNNVSIQRNRKSSVVENHSIVTVRFYFLDWRMGNKISVNWEEGLFTMELTIRDILNFFLDTPIFPLVISIVTFFILIKLLEKYGSFLDRFKFIKESFWISIILFSVGAFILLKIWDSINNF